MIELNDRQWLYKIFTVAIVLVTLLSIFLTEVSAAQQFNFPNYATTPEEALKKPTYDSIITELHGISSGTVPDSLNYTVEHLVKNSRDEWVESGDSNSYRNAVPFISGPTSQEFTLFNINLYPGMNRITVESPNNPGNPGIYVYFGDAPSITSITLADGRELTGRDEVIVEDEDQLYIIDTVNASSVSVNGIVANGYGRDSFSISNIPLTPGRNKLSFVVSNSTNLVTFDRTIIYAPAAGTIIEGYFYDKSDSAIEPIEMKRDGMVSPAEGENELPEDIRGVIYIPISDDPSDPKPTLDDVVITKNGNGYVHLDSTHLNDLTLIRDDGHGHGLYEFTIDGEDIINHGITASMGSYPISENDTYRLEFNVTYHLNGEQFKVFPNEAYLEFEFKNYTTPYISNIYQLYGVENDGTGGSTGALQTRIHNLPLYLQIVIANADKMGSEKPTLSVTKDGTTRNVTLEPINDPSDGAGIFRVKISALPFDGGMEAEFKIEGASYADKYSVNLEYFPISSIDVYKINDGMNVDSKKIPAFEVEMRNFTEQEKNRLKIEVNDTPIPKSAWNDDSNTNLIEVDIDVADYELVEGANVIELTADSGNITIMRRITIYHFSSETPVIKELYPVPVQRLDDAEHRRVVEDEENKFELIDSTEGYVKYRTSENLADILFSVDLAETIIVMVDGKQLGVIPDQGTPRLDNSFAGGDIALVESDRINGYRIENLPLNLGTTSIVIRGIYGRQPATSILEIERYMSPYELKSPKLPQERVVNQNFVPVIIKAEGADAVIINKEPMKKEIRNNIEYFTYEVTGLKKGNNRIKFTVIRGDEEIDDQFEVYYANTNTVGAQYKAPLGSRGKIDAFNRAFELKFDKGTLLTTYDEREKVELFEEQPILIGIANKEDGRTQTTYNHYGDIEEIRAHSEMIRNIKPPAHFGYASDLYYIDAGYFEEADDTYKTVGGIHPYYGEQKDVDRDLSFWRRNGDQYLKPTSRGELTLQFDPSIPNHSANRVTVARLSYSDGYANSKWEILGGVVNTKKNTITVKIDSFGYYAVFFNTYGFDDSQSHRNRDQMDIMFARGIMNAKRASEFGGEFGAYEQTTRGEFATILVKVLGLELDYDNSDPLFVDIPMRQNINPYWDYRYIETAGRSGLVRGIGPRYFVPNDPVTREQAAYMIAVAMNLKMNEDHDKVRANLQKEFADANSISQYALAAVEAVFKEKLMVGRLTPSSTGGEPLTTFDPKANITRAETAILIYNMMKEFKML